MLSEVSSQSLISLMITFLIFSSSQERDAEEKKKEIRAYLNKSNKNAGYAPMNAAKHQTGRNEMTQ